MRALLDGGAEVDAHDKARRPSLSPLALVPLPASRQTLDASEDPCSSKGVQTLRAAPRPTVALSFHLTRERLVQNQWTPLLWAAYMGQEAVVRALAAAGADVQAPTVVCISCVPAPPLYAFLPAGES